MNILHMKSIKLTPCVSIVVSGDFVPFNSDGKASLKRQKLPETTTDTQGMSKFY